MGEQARILLAIVLSFLVFYLSSLFFGNNQPVQEESAQKPTLEETSKKGKEAAKEIAANESGSVETISEARPEKTDVTQKDNGAPVRTITVDTPLFSVDISESGARFTSFILKDYRKTVDSDSPLLNMINPEINPGTLGLNIPDVVTEDAVYRSKSEATHINVTRNENVSFRWISEDGLQIEKIYSFKPDTYTIGLKVAVRNGTGDMFNKDIELQLTKEVPKEEVRYGFEGPSAYINESLKQIKTDDFEEEGVQEGSVRWIALQDRYFLSSIAPDKMEKTIVEMGFQGDTLLKSTYFQHVAGISSGEKKTFNYRIYFGPKSMKVLGNSPDKLDKAIYFGWFDFIAKPCVWVLNKLHDVIPNYGLAIIILTIMIKAVLWPLGNKSYKSMAAMKKLQPLVGELREKYKDDKKKMNEEMMALYRTYKVNPMGGCLPMVLQIPVFFALYRMLYETIELRHAPFFGWINDLSAPDRLGHFDVTLPFFQPPVGIPVLTIVMGATMFLQQKMSPPPGDPAQARMMMFMPLIFTFIFVNFSSGLVLYWLVNNVISIAQQYFVQKKNA